eukprot:5414062-Ditylum_brightwellii.AAC.1
MRLKRSKTWDMRFHWPREKAVRKALDISWDKGINNDADYYTKHHSPSHHKVTRPQHILKGFNLAETRQPVFKPTSVQ